MTDRSGAAIVVDTLSHIVLTIWSIEWSRYVSFLGRAIAFPVRVAWVPLSYAVGALRILFAPALYLFSYFVALCNAVIAFFVSLQPLYTFFGIATAVGIIAGITLATSSSIITSNLGMQDDPYEEPRKLGKALPSYSPITKDESSSNEADWYWADPSPSRRRPATGLLSQTILEEEDDSDI